MSSLRETQVKKYSTCLSFHALRTVTMRNAECVHLSFTRGYITRFGIAGAMVIAFTLAEYKKIN